MGRSRTRHPAALLDDSVQLAVGTRFHPDGRVREYKGNTIVCRVDPASGLFGILRYCQEQFARSAAGPSMAFLPPPSFHMTLFQGLNDQERTADRWSCGIPADLAIEEVNQVCLERLRQVNVPDSFGMRPNGFAQGRNGGGLLLNLQPDGPAEEHKLQEARRRLGEALGLQRRLEEKYRFHISLSYQIRWMTTAEQARLTSAARELTLFIKTELPVFQARQPEFCVFESMFHFEPLLRLGPRCQSSGRRDGSP